MINDDCYIVINDLIDDYFGVLHHWRYYWYYTKLVVSSGMVEDTQY